ncbi:MAG: glycosyltransferase family 2 protein [Candidatus Adiutrix sp.]
MPLISIIVPIYDVEQYLEKCLNSLLAQTYLNLEIILINDGSPDNCGAICDKYAAKDKRIVVIHQENGGVSVARNAGLAAAKGEYIGFVDPDDWVEPTMFGDLYENLRKNGADVSIGGLVIHYPQGWVEVRSFPEIEGVIYRETALEYLLSIKFYSCVLCDKLFARSLFTADSGYQLRLNPQIHCGEDFLLTAQLIAQAKSVYYTPTPFYHYMLREGSASQSYNEKRKTTLMAFSKIIDLFAQGPANLNKLAKSKYVEAAARLLQCAALAGRPDDVPAIKQALKPYFGVYLRNPAIKLKAKLAIIIIIMCPKLSGHLWAFLRTRLHMRWDSSK